MASGIVGKESILTTRNLAMVNLYSGRSNPIDRNIRSDPNFLHDPIYVRNLFLAIIGIFKCEIGVSAAINALENFRLTAKLSVTK